MPLAQETLANHLLLPGLGTRGVKTTRTAQLMPQLVAKAHHRAKLHEVMGQPISPWLYMAASFTQATDKGKSWVRKAPALGDHAQVA